MSASAQDDDGRAAEFSDEQFSAVTRDGSFGEAGDFGISQPRVHIEIAQDVIEPAAQHDAERGAQAGDFLDAGDGVFHARIKTQIGRRRNIEQNKKGSPLFSVGPRSGGKRAARLPSPLASEGERD